MLADARLALRTWRKTPGFTAVAIVSIALGIGANTAIFTLVDQVLLRVLPVQDPHELVQVTFTGSRYGSNWGDGSELSYPMYSELRDHNEVFSGMFARFGYSFHIGHGGRTERVAGEIVSGSYFPVLGVDAALGRTLTPEDDRLPGAHPVAVISHGFWVSGFAADPGVVNSPLVINGNSYTVVGVAQPGFDGIEVGRRIGFGGNPNTPTPIEIVGVVRDSKYTDVRDDIQRQVFFPYLESSQPSGFTVYVRTGQPADRMFDVVRQTMREIDPNLPVYGTRSVERQVAQSLSRERLVSTMTATFGTLATLLAVVGLYGVMSYTVSRRTREIGVRVAFGASAANIRWLVIREVLVIAAAGIALALPAAWWLGRYVSAQLYNVEPTDAAVAVLAGLVPSSRAARLDPTTALRAD